MTEPIVVSIPYSGTRFLKERLGIDDHEHTNVPWDKLVDRVQGKHIIAPLRSPEAVFRSWCRRRSARDEEYGHSWLGRFFSSYGFMHTLDQMFDIDYVCVDKCEDERITDWTKVGDDDTDGVGSKIQPVDLRTLYWMPFVYRHYEPTIDHRLHVMQYKEVANG